MYTCLVCVVQCTDLQLNLTLLQLHKDRAKKMLLRTLASFSVPGQQQQHRNVHLDHRRGRIECKCPPHVQFKLLCWSIGTAYCHHWRKDFTPLPPLGLRDISVCLFIYGPLPFFLSQRFSYWRKKITKSINSSCCRIVAFIVCFPHIHILHEPVMWNWLHLLHFQSSAMFYLSVYLLLCFFLR